MRPARITHERGTVPSQEAACSSERHPRPAYLWVPTLKAFSITEKASNVDLKKKHPNGKRAHSIL